MKPPPVLAQTARRGQGSARPRTGRGDMRHWHHGTASPSRGRHARYPDDPAWSHHRHRAGAADMRGHGGIHPMRAMLWRWGPMAMCWAPALPGRFPI